MQELKYWQTKIADKRKQTSFRDFLLEICSWYPSSLHKNNGLISKFPDTPRVKKIIPNSEFEKNRDALVNDIFEYDFEETFFENFRKLFMSIDMFHICHYWENVNCDFWESVLNGKNVYLSFGIISDCENIWYSVSIKDNCQAVFNSIMVQQSQYTYCTSDISESYNVFYSRYIGNSNNIWFSTNLVGCSECIGCDNLDNEKYCINNIQYEKAEYLRLKDEILKDKEGFLKKYQDLKLGWNNIGCENVVWNALFNCFDVDDSMHSFNTKWGKNLIFCGWALWVEEAYDICGGWSPTARHIYGVAWVNGEHVYCGSHIIGSHIFYSYYLENCSYCIGCVWLKNKQYCILNKQYSKDDWHRMADKIFSQMEMDWVLWEFFPGELNPFYFNDTMATILWDFTKDEVTEKWYLWREQEIKTDIPEWSDIIQTSDLDRYQWYDTDKNWKINPDILSKVIVDEKWNYYRIVRMEYDFLMKHALPLPEIHWIDRMKLNFWM